MWENCRLYVLIDCLICPYNCLVCWYALIFLNSVVHLLSRRTTQYTRQSINGVNCGDHCPLHFRPLSSHHVNLCVNCCDYDTFRMDGARQSRVGLGACRSGQGMHCAIDQILRSSSNAAQLINWSAAQCIWSNAQLQMSATCTVCIHVRRIWSICTFDQTRCASD